MVLREVKYDKWKKSRKKLFKDSAAEKKLLIYSAEDYLRLLKEQSEDSNLV